MTAKTGEKCPVSGVWKVDGFPTTTGSADFPGW